MLNAIRAGLALLTWEKDAFAYAETYDESAGRYRGLRSGAQMTITQDDTGLLVRPEIARRQIDQESAPPVPADATTAPTPSPAPGVASPTAQSARAAQPPKPKR